MDTIDVAKINDFWSKFFTYGLAKHLNLTEEAREKAEQWAGKEVIDAHVKMEARLAEKK